MGEKLLCSRDSVDKSKFEYIDRRRISLPAFSSDSGKDIPNYLRASIGSCHDYCKYGKETVSVRQNRPWIKKTAPESQVVFPTVKSAMIARINASNKQPLEKGESKHSAESDTTSESKHLKAKSLVKKPGATSGAKKSQKLKRVVPPKVGSNIGGRNSLDLQLVGEVMENKSKVTMVKRSSVVKKHETVTKSPIHQSKKLNAETRPPLSPSPKLTMKAKTPPSKIPPPVIPITKSRPLPSSNQLKAKSIVAHSPSSSATKKNKYTTLKVLPPLPPRNASIKKKLNFNDQNAKKRDSPKTRVTKVAATRSGSIAYTSNTATKLKRKGLRPENSVNDELDKAKEIHEKKEEEPNQERMESYNEVPEKILYVIEMETGDIMKPISLGPSSTSGCMDSSTQDESTYTESEVDYIIHEDDHLVDGENLKGAENAKLNKSATIPLEDYSKDPVKLTFRRGRVIDITLEDNAPRRLNFRREHVVKENISNMEIRKRNFTITEATQDNATMENNSGTVVLRHQDVQDKKDTKGLYNNVIEETASKLAEIRKSKVKALVGAFETVISLQDGKPAATS